MLVLQRRHFKLLTVLLGVIGSSIVEGERTLESYLEWNVPWSNGIAQPCRFRRGYATLMSALKCTNSFILATVDENQGRSNLTANLERK
jgi:hypothetical protein